MKIDRNNPLHWLWLALSGGVVCLARLLRSLAGKPAQPLVFLYGHKLNGNLLALYEYHVALAEPGFELRFLTMDPAYYRALRRQGVAVSLSSAPGTILQLARARVIVSDHGLHVLKFLRGCSGLAFVDVWHGIPYKGFDAEDFAPLHHYDEVWVASPLMEGLYAGRYGFSPAQVHVTGYARTDVLVDGEATTPCAGLLPPSVPASRPLVLFAPTWKQDVDGRSLYPFGLDETGFLALLDTLAEETGCHFLLRMHLNAAPVRSAPAANVTPVPASHYPDTERLLLHSDVLISDWSSILFDYLLLRRPAIFLDVPPPFRKGFSLGPEYRHGRIVADVEALVAAVREAVLDPDRFLAEHQERQAKLREEVYGAFADGQASRRCHERLRGLLESPG